MTLAKIVDACNYLLYNYPEAISSKDYLSNRLNKDTQDTFQFGYFPNASNISALIDLVGEENLKNEGLVYSKIIEDALFPRVVKSCYFENFPLIMPFKNIYGETVALVGRTLLSDEERKTKQIKSKYKNSAESSCFKKGNLLFGLYENKSHILDQNCVYIVEGQFDVIKAFEIGFRNIVALGSAMMSAYQFSVINRYSNNIFLLLDNDEAGQKGRRSIINKFGDFANIKNLYLPEEYKDIDEYIKKQKINDYSELSFEIKD